MASLGKMILMHNCFPFIPIIIKLHTKSPHESRMCPMDFLVKRSSSQCIDYWKLLMLHNCFPFTLITMKLYTKTLHESRMCSIDFGVQRSRSQCIDYWKWLMLHNCFPFTLIMKFHTKTPHEPRMCSMDFWVQRSRSHCIDYWKWSMLHNCFPKVKVTMHWLMKMDFGASLLSLYTFHYETSYKNSPWVEDVPCALLILVSKSQGHNALIPENWFWCIIAFPLHLSSWIFIPPPPPPPPLSQWHALLILGVKGQGHNAVITEMVFVA